MDFFSQQDRARRYSRILYLYFFIAVIAIVVLVNLALYFSLVILDLYPDKPVRWYTDGLVYYVSMATVLLILSGSVMRWFKLRSGGHAVARMVGAKLLDLHSSDAKERQLINVIEEMSIASGVPLPAIYTLKEEPGINAFVAGYEPTQAVIVVTGGTIESLDRNELQGVMAHEYSHILNGDMQINVRLMSLLAGILMISVIGRILSSGNSRHYRIRSRSSSRVTLIGLALMATGYVGVFFGRIIKAAVSRQREYLADAASVQFTRNPEGIASALNKIRQASNGSMLNNEHLEEMSHMCFSQVFRRQFRQWQATHPPLEERIRRIDPGFLARIRARQLSKKNKESAAPDNRQVSQPVAGFASQAEVSLTNTQFAPMVPLTAQEFVATSGKLDQAHMEYAHELHQSLTPSLIDAAHDTESAKAIVLAMILRKMNLQTGMQVLQKSLTETQLQSLETVRTMVFDLDDEQRLPLFDMCLPALKLMMQEGRTAFLALCKKLIKSDKKYTLFEFVLITLLQQNLSEEAGRRKKIKYYSFKPVSRELQLIFSVMALAGGGSRSDRHQAYRKVSRGFSMQSLEMLGARDVSIEKMVRALEKLSQLSPILKRSVLEACADIVVQDQQLKASETELLRAIADTLQSPVPPLLPS